jgi:hypothetical protein
MSQPKSPNVNGSLNYLALDPGLTTGWAHWDAKGNFELFGSIAGLDNLSDFLENLKNQPQVIIMEDYIINPRIPQGGTKVVASEAIGRISHYARIRRIDIIRQPNTIKPIAYKWAQAPVPKRKADTHQFDAFAHGEYYLIKNRIKPHPILKEFKT